MNLQRFLRFCLVQLACVAALAAQVPSASPSLTDISVAPGFNHAPARLSINYGGNTPTELSRLSVTSNASWVSGAISASERALVLNFATSNLVNRSYTATLTLSDGAASSQVSVRATISLLNITVLADDPVRSASSPSIR